ncbi:MAG TPA: FAD-binding oxidoreductase [Acidimicrobiia bacterium]|nr:FAD-binding oxidoreductase [Acidimicrobiia bacterium]
MKLDGAVTRPLWWDAVPTEPTRPRLEGAHEADVVIVGAGFTGLWCAYHLARLRPGLAITVVEATHVGFGASGRNGGWCHAEYPLGREVLEADHGRDAARAHIDALRQSVRDVGSLAAAEGIECDYHLGGVLAVARLGFQDGVAREEVASAVEFGDDPAEIRHLDADEARAMLGATSVVGGVWHAHGAAVQPAKLVHGLAAAAERRGVTIFEASPVRSIGDRVVETDAGRVSAGMVVRATEGYTAGFAGRRREIVPLYSLMVATEPLPPEVWDVIGLADRPVFCDFRNLLIYGQRTADDRLAFGGRGAPYHFGSTVKPSFDIHDGVHRELVRVLLEMFPVLEGTKITHRWGGPLGVSRDWRPSVVCDHDAGFAWAGGYVGDGVATAQLAGRTLAELIAGEETERTSLPWVGHTSRRWEIEPLRWVGINAGLQLAKRADRSEERRQAPSRLARIGNWLRGKG